MTITRQNSTSLGKTIGTPRESSLAWKVGRFSLHLLEMLVAMAAGMGLFHLLEGLLPETSNLATALKSGSSLHTIVMNLFMTVPMVAWMIIRQHGWRHSLEMVFAMLGPIATVSLLCNLALAEYLPWLADASGPAMFLGMIGAMLYRRSHYTGQNCD